MEITLVLSMKSHFFKLKSGHLWYFVVGHRFLLKCFALQVFFDTALVWEGWVLPYYFHSRIKVQVLYRPPLIDI